MVINRVLVLVLGFVSIVIFSDCIFLCLAQNGTRPATVNVGALVAYNTTIGRVAKKAIELALEDINNDETLLNGTRLVLTMMDSNCSAFIGTSAALELMKKKNMAILGPQSSVIAHVVSNIASELQVPIMSFGATDPTLSSYQYPYFLRMTHSDIYEMEAVAAVIGFYGWRHIVVMYIDDDYGRNGIAALSDALETVRAKIVNKVAFAPGVSNNEIGSVLVQLALMESRVFVVHMNPDAGMNLFSEALNLGMLSSSYVWIATDWLSSLLDSNLPDYETMNSLQGVIALRPYVPISVREHAFTVGWNNLFKARSVDVHLNAFGLYAYDATWAIAYSIDNFFSKGGNNSFKNYPQLSNASGSQTQLAKLKVFTGGPELQKILLQSNFTGLTGPVKFGKNGDLLASSFEIINIIGTGFRKVSYWTNHSGLSAIPPQNRVAKSHAQHIVDQKMRDIIWPGESKLVPRGWVFPNNGKHLLVGVPRKVGFQEFVRAVEGTNMMKGFCIDVFVAAVNLLPYPVPYTFVSFGNGKSSPNYDELMQQLASKNFDAVVGDITIVTNRAKIVDFTQPYIDSGLAIVTSLHEANPSGTWAFLQPFTLEMWCATFAFFLIMGAVVWSLEHKSNPDFRGNPKKQAMTILWRKYCECPWTSSASNMAICCFNNQFQLYCKPDFNSHTSYAKALSQGPKNGGVGAIIDELPVIQLFLSTECSFRTVGLEFTKGGWGFAFPKESPLAIDMSTAILTLSESGELQRIHDKWLSRNRCGSQETQIDASQLQLKSFWGLFLITGVVSFTAFVVFLGCKIFQFIQHFRHTNARDGPLLTSSSLMSRILHRLQLFAKFIDEKEIVDKKEGSAPISERCETEFLT
ncbi:glutamate receptor 3.3 isoform X3 [Cryptomeria japonica]|uniref:glutamate receptor 3.3 isoform X3 n=1 Tax=Cryptomeria japonica TaxID=3369 RepID=UPI0027D9FDDB|nr:glutamate receptor 3.3 isoform X3 [Cryptomeria japonica]